MRSKNEIVWASTGYGEARGEPYLGRVAVMWVIHNRAEEARRYIIRTGKPKHPLFGDGTELGACFARLQFSCWNKSDPNRVAIIEATHGDKLAGFYAILDGIVGGGLGDPTFGATHYHTIVAPGSAKVWPPEWAAEMHKTAVIGAHQFYGRV